MDAELTSSHLRATSRPSKTHVWYRGYSTGTEFDMPEICSIGAVCQPCAIRSLPSSVLWPGFYNGKPCNETQQAIPNFIRNGWYTIEFHRISIFLQVYMGFPGFPQQIMLFCIKKRSNQNGLGVTHQDAEKSRRFPFWIPQIIRWDGSRSSQWEPWEVNNAAMFCQWQDEISDEISDYICIYMPYMAILTLSDISSDNILWWMMHDNDI